MTRVIRDPVGVTHKFEAAWWHNTRCGQCVTACDANKPWLPLGGVDGEQLPQGVVDCMACLAGPSHLTMYDLQEGKEVRAWVRLDGVNGPIGSAKPITFTDGVNIDEVIFDDLPIGVPVNGYSYYDEDGRNLGLHVNARPGTELVRRSEDDTIAIRIGGAVVL